MLVELQYESKKSMWRSLKECGVEGEESETEGRWWEREKKGKEREREVSRGQKARNEASLLVRETREGDVYDESLARNEWERKREMGRKE